MVVRERSLFRCDVYDGLRLRTDVARDKSVLFFSSSQVVEYFTKHDTVLLVASGTSLKTANIFEVMHTSVITLNVSEFSEIASVLLLLRQQQLDLLPVVDKQGNIVSNITPKSICQALVQKTEKTRVNTSIGSFEVEHQILIERQFIKYKCLLTHALVRKDTICKHARLIGVSRDCQDGQAVFEIQNWGIGIPEKDIPYLFESFDPAINDGNILGTGLGMAIIKKCVDI